MKKIRLFSTKAVMGIEGEEAELYVNFYLVLNKNYIFTFLIDAPNLSCSGRNPIKLWKKFLIMFEEENVKYMRRYENLMEDARKWKKVQSRIGYFGLYNPDDESISETSMHHLICAFCDNDKCVRGTKECEFEQWKEKESEKENENMR